MITSSLGGDTDYQASEPVARMSPSDAFLEDSLVIHSKCKHSIFEVANPLLHIYFQGALEYMPEDRCPKDSHCLTTTARNETGLNRTNLPAGLQGIRQGL